MTPLLRRPQTEFGSQSFFIGSSKTLCCNELRHGIGYWRATCFPVDSPRRVRKFGRTIDPPSAVVSRPAEQTIHP